jgi:hypothetical protein
MKSHGEATRAKSVEDSFDRGEDVLDYFDVRKARVIDPFLVYGSVSIPDDFGWPCRASSLIIRDCETLHELLHSH